jgi:hypothetical protein
MNADENCLGAADPVALVAGGQTSQSEGADSPGLSSIRVYLCLSAANYGPRMNADENCLGAAQIWAAVDLRYRHLSGADYGPQITYPSRFGKGYRPCFGVA